MTTTQPVPSVDVLAAQVREQLWPHVEPAEQEAPMRAARAALDALVARVTASEHERDFWKQRYDTQHGTVHRLEDALADARNALERLIDDAEPALRDVFTNSGDEDAAFDKATCALDAAREVLARLDGSQP